jgi:PKD repeat protein
VGVELTIVLFFFVNEFYDIYLAMNYFTKIITLGFVALSFVTFGQLSNQQTIFTNSNSVEVEKCGTHSLHMQKMNTDNTYRQKMEAFETYTHSDHDRVSQTNLKIPVVVHVITEGTSLTDITDAQIEQAVLAMNQMYRKVPGTKGDGDGVDVGFEFALAVRDPDGNCTTGITRYDHSGNATYAASGVERNTIGISDASLKSLVVWDQNSYYNIWLVSEIDGNNGGAGIQGYATLAGSHGSASDGAVILANNFENVESTTGVHEIGHSFNLYHTFQDDDAGCPANGDCTTDGDLVCDTPPHERSSSDCVVGVNGCDGGSSTELFIHNYMDYSSDACQNMFTQGQKDRMIDAINFIRDSYLASNGNMSLVPPEVANVDFTSSKTFICQGDAVSFIDISSCTPNTFLDTTSWAGISFLWSITNGVDNYNSTLQNPIFNFPNVGTYDVTLQVTNQSGTTSLTKQGSVVVGLSPTAACSPTSNNESNFGRTINNVLFNTINNTTSQNVNVAYTDYSCDKTTIVSSGNNPISITTNAVNANCVFEVYIDYNNNGVFDNPTELAYSGSNTSGGLEVSNGTITIPGTAVTDVNLRMRVINESGTISANERNCVSPFFVGDVEDYGVMISDNVAEVSIAVAPSSNITYATATTFTATPVNGGATPTYVWYLNGIVVGGEISSTYVTSTLVDGDEVHCEMTSNLSGVIASPASSNVITMTVTGAPLSDFSVSQTQSCTSSPLQFTDESLLDPTSWNWTFTGGTPNVSTDQNPSVSYAAPGTYEVVLTASNGSGAGTTETKTDYITILASPATICTFTRTEAPIAGIGLTNVTLNEINNSTAFDDAVFNDFSCTNITSLDQNTLYNISTTVGGSNDQWLRVYIDYNNNGDFNDAGELVFSPADGTGVRSGSFTTPVSPIEDELLRMRVITDFTNTIEGNCTSPLEYGQVEDYAVIFTSSCTAPVIDTEPSAEVVCENAVSTFEVAATGSSLVYSWEESTDGIVFIGISNGGIYSGADSPTLTLTNTPIGNSTYEYRCVITSACGGITSAEVALTVNALDDASYSYDAAAYCVNASDPSPTITGLAGGGFTSAPAGLSINAGSGLIDVSASTPGVYTVTYTTAGSCPNSADETVKIVALDDASFSYSAASYCVNESNPSATVTGLPGGGFTFAPAGLSMNGVSGKINLAASTPGTYTITYSTNGFCPNTSDQIVTVNAVDDASFSYPLETYCADAADPIATITGLAGGGFTSAPAGLVINASTGLIDLSASAANTYTITYTTVGSCPNSEDAIVSIKALDDAGFNYSSASYCVNDVDPTATVTGEAGGGFTSAPAGLAMNGVSGFIDVSASIEQAYTITYTTTGACPNSSSESVAITNIDDASFSYDAAAYCSNDSDPAATITGVAGGGFTSAPAGLSINASTGAIDVSASTPGTYTVTYTTIGACANSSDETVTINSLDDASYSYDAAAYCVNAPDPTPTITGLAGGGFTSAPAGLSMNAGSGLIDVSASTPGVYTVTYTTVGVCANSSDETVTINALDDASFSYALNSYQTSESDPTATISGLAGGTFSSLPGGLVIDAGTGEIDLSTSAVNDYVVTYTTNGSCPNSEIFNIAVTNAVQTTTIQPQFCGEVVTSLNQPILSIHVPGATNYRYRITPTDLSSGPLVYTRNSHSYSMKLAWYGNGVILYNTSYEVEVAVFVGGAWSEYGNACQIITPAIPQTKLMNTHCGQVVSGLDQSIFAEQVPGATNYKYRATPTDLSAASVEYYRNSHSYSMKLDWFGAGVISHNTSYEIEVAVYVEGAWTAYGDACQVITPAIPVTLTKLNNSHCGQIVASMNQSLLAEPITGATNYRYRATPTDLSAAAIVYTRNSNSYAMKLIWFGNGAIKYNTSYEIEVASFVDGVWSDYGAACQVITPVIPETRLQNTYCGQVVSSLSQTLLSVHVPGATNYKYRATPTDLSSASVEYFRNSHSYSLKLIWFGAGVILDNTSYEIEVSAFVDGLWTDYGTACQVITPAGASSLILVDQNETSNDEEVDEYSGENALLIGEVEEIKESSFSIYPNPTTGLFTLQSEVDEAKFRIVSIDGRQVHPPSKINNGSKSIDLSFVEKGVYLVILEKGNQQLIKRIIIN